MGRRNQVLIIDANSFSITRSSLVSLEVCALQTAILHLMTLTALGALTQLVWARGASDKYLCTGVLY
jgi:hypothetical protein